MVHGELEDTIHHIIHSEAPDQLQQRVKIFIAQDRARGLDANNRQQFPRISARLPHGGMFSNASHLTKVCQRLPIKTVGFYL